MNIKRPFELRVGIGVGALLLSSGVLANPSYTVEQITIPGTLSAYSQAYLNDNNQVVIENANDPTQGTTHYLIENDQATAFYDINVRDMNDAGQVVGGCPTPKGTRACYWTKSGGHFLLPLVQTPDGVVTLTEGRSINESGQIVGTGEISITTFPYFRNHAYIWDATNGAQIIGEGWANVITDDGSVHADVVDGGWGQWKPVIWKNGETVFGGLLYGYGLNEHYYVYSDTGLWDPVNGSHNLVDFEPNIGANAINNKNQIAGALINLGHAALWDNGTVYDLNDLIPATNGLVLEYAFDINETGDIVAKGNIDGVDAIYLLKAPRTSTPSQYTLTTFDVPVNGRVEPMSINDAGKVVGYVRPNQSGPSDAFTWTPSGGTSLIGYYHSRAFVINNNGVIGGLSGYSHIRYQTSVFPVTGGRIVLGGRGGVSGLNEDGLAVGTLDRPNGARLWNLNTGEAIALGTFGGTYNNASAVNNHGQVVGSAQNASGVYRAFIYEGDTGLRDLNLPGTGSNYGHDINDSGTIIGGASTSSEATCTGSCGYVTNESGQWEVLPSLDSTMSNTARSINEDSLIVGYSGINGDNRAVIWLSGKVFDLNDYAQNADGWVLNEAREISDNGQIVGIGLLNGARKSFVLTPVQ